MSVVRDCYSGRGECPLSETATVEGGNVRCQRLLQWKGGVSVVRDCFSGGGECQRLKCTPVLRHCVALGKVETGDDCVVPKARSSSILLSCAKNPWGHLDRVVDGVGGNSSGGGGEGPW